MANKVKTFDKSRYEYLCRVAVVAPYETEEKASHFLTPERTIIFCDGHYFVVENKHAK